MRNACERYHELKNRILIDEICQLLPPNPDSWRRRKMSIQDVLWNAVRYIDILTETLRINDKTREALERISLGASSAEVQFILKNETEMQQQELNAKLENRLFACYGNSCPRQGSQLGYAEGDLNDIICTLEKLGFSGTRCNSLGFLNDPLTLGKPKMNASEIMENM